MGSMSIWHWLVVAGIVVLLFGGGRISAVMGDMAKGVKAFKKGLEDEPVAPSAAPIANETVAAAATVKSPETSHS